MNIQVIFYSMYGHVYRLAEAVVAGAREVPGAEVTLYQVAELVPEAALERTGAKAARAAFAHVPLARPTSSPRPTPSSSAPPRVSATCAPRCATSWTRPAASG